MMNFKKVDLSFQSCQSEYNDADVVLLSVPMDATCSFRPGTRFAGNAIRVDSMGLEWYSVYQDKDLKDYQTCDIGDLEIPMGDVEKALLKIEQTSRKIIQDGKKVVTVGGEHLITYPLVKVHQEAFPDLHLIHFDAHTDLRDEFLGRKLSHATVLRRCYDLLGPNKIFQFGIRSGEKNEFEWAKKSKISIRKFDLFGLEKVVEKLKDKPVYVTIDLDVLDPAYFPGTGTPEPGGISYKELLEGILKLRDLNCLVGIDMVELAPHYDSSGVSTAVACKTLRELILLLHQRDLC